MMKAVFKTRKEPGAIEVRETDVPRPGPDDILVKVQAGGVCGTDVHVYEYTRGYEFIRTPLILGHEFSGAVVEAGSRVEGFQAGDRVVAESVHYCGQCRPCRLGRTDLCRDWKVRGLHLDGGFAGYATYHARYAHHVPAGVTPEQAALTEPASCAAHAVAQGPRIQPGDRVVVTGVGPIGIMIAQLAKLAGAASVIVTGIERDEESRFSVARSLGLRTVNVEREDLGAIVREMTDGYGADIVFEASGVVPALLQGIDLLRKGGHMVLLGIHSRPAEVYFTDLIRRGLSIHTSITSVWKDYEAVLGLMARGELKVQPLIETFPLENVVEAIEGSLKGRVMKAVLIP